MRAENHHRQGDVEIGRISHKGGWSMIAEGYDFSTTHYDTRQEAEEEHERADETKDMHRLQSEAIEEPKR